MLETIVSPAVNFFFLFHNNLEHNEHQHQREKKDFLYVSFVIWQYYTHFFERILLKSPFIFIICQAVSIME